MAYEPYYEYYNQRGFSFDRDLLTTYCLSLHTKPFVILSGISGTGKTKIAQLFNVPALEALHKEKPKPAIPPRTGQWITMNVTTGLTTGDGRGNLHYSDLGALLDQNEINSLQSRIEHLRSAGVEDNICDPFAFTITTPDGQILKAKAYLQRASSPLLRVRFKSKRGEDEYDSTKYFSQHYPVGTALKLEKIADKKLRIVSVNDEDVLQVNQAMEEEEDARIKNTLFIPVRSDWTDATPLFGYYNLVDQRYHLTPVLNFILTAKEHPNLPFFLILDEMNLAKVEHYFSDFLSCLESRHIDNDILKQEPIHLHSGSSWIETNSEYFDLIAPTLELPPNLFVTGTVNIDESTYMFSPKVLDRANVIELNHVNIHKYAGNADATPASTYILNKFPLLTQFTLPQRSDFEKLPPDAQSFLIDVHSILAKYHLHFGYRVINEVSHYIMNALEYCEPNENLIKEALDWQMVQKVLPKFSGSQNKLDAPIRELLEFLSTGQTGIAMGLDMVSKLEPSTTKYPRTTEKLKRMSLTLMINGFANFIE
jgi:hypothetical protein